MPYQWSPDHRTLTRPVSQTSAEPILRLDVWPHRSMPNTGFKTAIWVMFIAGCLPVVAFIGTAAFWVLLACLLLTLAALWTALRRSDRPHLREQILIWPNQMALSHWTAKGELKTWEANPYWVKIHMRAGGGPVEHYLTLQSSATDTGRAVELGRFLSPEERQALRNDLAFVLSQLRAG
ncbi:DUF2244 domain-containing protein [Pacificibacter marinus]|uniref:DUF2244 domain-containing protein n=1 Tax=Pacificibacter marinus TaxID=658057 RepID=A0A1Y5SI39_9RHOB|nr:Uncharacterized membrane protein [Pacificibacter marinus]SLN40645.1 hypothetical protein PAM7971_01845 [Pacificibacter marinus]